MRTFIISAAAAWASLLPGLAGCALPSPDALDVTARSVRSTASPETPAVIAVTAENTGEVEAEWGRGSSSCQLHLLVRVAGKDYPAFSDRACTADLAKHSLRPGESRTEEITWTGQIVRDDSVERLDPGTYEVRGAAGDAAASAPVVITVEEES